MSTFYVSILIGLKSEKKKIYNRCLEDQLSEVESYQKQEIPSSEKCTLLEYWNANESTFPGLSILARRIFSVMATSSASERNFSLAGATVSARRSCLSSTSVNSILFLNSALRNKEVQK